MAENGTSSSEDASRGAAQGGAGSEGEAYDPGVVAQLGTSTGSDQSAPERGADFSDASHPTSLGVSDGVPADLAHEERRSGTADSGDESGG